MPVRKLFVVAVALVVGLGGGVGPVGAGDLNPPLGPIAPTNRAQLNAQTVSFPIIIGLSGSYVLTSNLIGISGQNGIVIVVDDVTIDLNGFSLVGVAGSTNGILVSGARKNVAVLNGNIRGWGGHGLTASAAQNCRFSELLTTGNGGDGVRVGNDSLVVGLNSASNVGAGIVVAGDGNRVEGCHLVLNGTGMLVSGQNNLIVKNSSSDNTVDFNIGIGNAYGPIAVVSGVGDISSVANAGHPWANFSSTCVPQTWCLDSDTDGFGDAGSSLVTCPQPSGYVADCTDCNDADFDINPSAPELCDNVDNNCNTNIDEGNPESGQSCDTGVPGVCAVGTTTCQAGSLACPQIVFPSAEVCDGLDNNCDGTVDDGNPGGGAACSTGQPGVCDAGTESCQTGAIACVPDVSPSSEICDGLDNNCDGAVDEGNPGGGSSCATGQPGVCANGTLTCGGGSLSCQPDTAASAEVCDGLDNNCDGATDEGNPGGGAACSTGLQGVCAAGTDTCQSGSIVCVQDIASSAEVCDGLDNNCDGATDEGNPGGGGACNTGLQGVCDAGTDTCQGGAIVCVQDVASSAEVCDGLDNNCDGATDEGNPGGGGACNTGLQGVCDAGTDTCQGGAIVCVQDVASSAEVCDGLDNDCNGAVDDGGPLCGANQTCTAGVCVGTLSNGTACTSGGECVSTFCADGFCCDTACTGLCEACSTALNIGTDGTCSFVQNGLESNDECAGAPTCDGAGACTP